MTLLPPARRPRVSTFADRLHDHGGRPALVDGDGVVTYAELARRADGVAERLDPGATGVRRLVLLEGANDVGTIAVHLACLRAGHPVLLVPDGAGGRTAGPVDAYDPDVVVSGGGTCWEERRPGSNHDLHPDLALLLSTSGSTGAAKLVRLSHANLEANAEAIASYLGLTGDDRAITSLPLAYCYGLSVLHSHLACGASVVLTDRSVMDDGFWRTFGRHRVTSLAGVPHTFELLDRIGFADLRLPSLRYVTQAGGRLDPETVRRYADLGRRRGFDLFVMYGQTEATARMAYLPPALAARHPKAIGVPIPGGELRLDRAGVDDAGDGADIGELVYRGPNVMLGYAHGPGDLALGATLEELRTGDLARVGEAGLFEIVGRRQRFVKPFGLRVDLDEVERLLRRRGIEAAVAGDDRRLVLAVPPGHVVEAAAFVQRHVGLPAGAVHVHGVDVLPRRPNGKPDHAAVLALGAVAAPPGGRRVDLGPVRRLYADALGVPDVGDDDTFVSLGGDSLSYVEVSVRLEEALGGGGLPDEWPAMTVADLERRVVTLPPHRRRPRSVAVETTVALRAAAIAVVVATHAGLVDLKGGAHLLLAVAGWNFARFQLPVSARRLAGSIGRVAVPTAAWIALLSAVGGGYGVANLLLVHTQLGAATWDPRWRFWFVEALVQALVVAGAVVALPPLRRLERHRPFAFALGVLAATLLLRVLAAGAGTVRRPQEVVWFFALGWAVHRARRVPERLLVSTIAVVGVVGFFGQPAREAIIVGGLLALVWLRSVPVPRPAHRAVALLASSSLAIYLTHWQVYPAVRSAAGPAMAVAASLALGVAAHVGGGRVSARLRRASAS